MKVKSIRFTKIAHFSDFIYNPENEINLIVGPIGCGKTTLLKIFNECINSIDSKKDNKYWEKLRNYFPDTTSKISIQLELADVEQSRINTVVLLQIISQQYDMSDEKTKKIFIENKIIDIVFERKNDKIRATIEKLNIVFDEEYMRNIDNSCYATKQCDELENIYSILKYKYADTNRTINLKKIDGIVISDIYIQHVIVTLKECMKNASNIILILKNMKRYISLGICILT